MASALLCIILTTGDVFVVHHDLQKGVGIKINYSHGLIRSALQGDITRMKSHIQGYSFHKFGYNACDKHICNLRDRTWPHSRGGHGTNGVFLNQHDFVTATLLQNIFVFMMK